MADGVTGKILEKSVTDWAPALPYIHAAEDGGYYLSGTRCGDCGTVTEGERLACPACAGRNALEPMRFPTGGKLYTYTIVHRSFPGVQTPFIPVVVDMDGGGTLRGTLNDIDPLAPMPNDLRVTLRFGDTGQRDAAGRPFICYDFTPERETTR